MQDKDRRKAKRFLVDLPIRFRIYPPSRPDNISGTLDAHLFDLSEQGMRIFSNHVRSDNLHILSPNLTTSEQCLLQIEVPHEKESLTLHGRVVWYDRNAEQNPYSFQIGIEFINFTADTKEKLKALIQHSSAGAVKT